MLTSRSNATTMADGNMAARSPTGWCRQTWNTRSGISCGWSCACARSPRPPARPGAAGLTWDAALFLHPLVIIGTVLFVVSIELQVRMVEEP
jgi:hypothetical protein